MGSLSWQQVSEHRVQMSWILKKEQNSAFIFLKPLSNSDSCYDVF